MPEMKQQAGGGQFPRHEPLSAVGCSRVVQHLQLTSVNVRSGNLRVTGSGARGTSADFRNVRRIAERKLLPRCSCIGRVDLGDLEESQWLRA